MWGAGTASQHPTPPGRGTGGYAWMLTRAVPCAGGPALTWVFGGLVPLAPLSPYEAGGETEALRGKAIKRLSWASPGSAVSGGQTGRDGGRWAVQVWATQRGGGGGPSWQGWAVWRLRRSGTRPPQVRGRTVTVTSMSQEVLRQARSGPVLSPGWVLPGGSGRLWTPTGSGQRPRPGLAGIVHSPPPEAAGHACCYSHFAGWGREAPKVSVTLGSERR